VGKPTVQSQKNIVVLHSGKHLLETWFCLFCLQYSSGKTAEIPAQEESAGTTQTWVEESQKKMLSHQLP
jgi:hypothetical protein